jgi:hypothetical protein
MSSLPSLRKFMGDSHFDIDSYASLLRPLNNARQLQGYFYSSVTSLKRLRRETREFPPCRGSTEQYVR